jgi:hypothetical protein
VHLCALIECINLLGEAKDDAHLNPIVLSRRWRKHDIIMVPSIGLPTLSLHPEIESKAYTMTFVNSLRQKPPNCKLGRWNYALIYDSRNVLVQKPHFI